MLLDLFHQIFGRLVTAAKQGRVFLPKRFEPHERTHWLAGSSQLTCVDGKGSLQPFHRVIGL